MVSYCLKKRKPLLEKMKKEMSVMVMIIKPTCKQPIEEIERDRRPEKGEKKIPAIRGMMEEGKPKA